MKIDVLMATYNGEQTLAAVLDGYRKVMPPEQGWQLVIVDNASTDGTRSLIKSYENDLPITYLYEAKPGKNSALNTGIKSLQGDLVILTDDDAIPCPDLLVQYREVAESEVDVSIFSGKVMPDWRKEPPLWMVDSIPLTTAYSLNAGKHSEGSIPPTSVLGPNMAVRREIFERGFRFDESIGPCGSSYAMGSETEFCTRLHGHGYNCHFSERPCVSHIIRDYQVNGKWLLKRSFQNGRGAANRDLRNAPGEFRLLAGIPKHYIKHAAIRTGTVILSLFSFDKTKIFTSLWECSSALGRIYEALKLRGT
ncbi:glycosyltransferase [Pseudodesulfovibrio cashew]|uniref:Glycosyltransferase n=1 Tax=Pseudodesulfovibrio cashew TaxID=2678688 RepID=A0A6I6JAC7_9BACT|nr:glycosyltransferase [Pseudodesulfovibrio cashew]QGY39021.1 glycosyltransferase [Pseudodesulfovibrio cashew]